MLTTISLLGEQSHKVAVRPETRSHFTTAVIGVSRLILEASWDGQGTLYPPSEDIHCQLALSTQYSEIFRFSFIMLVSKPSSAVY